MTSLRCSVHVSRLATFAAVSAVAVAAHAQQINEIRIDQPGADNSEYFELTGTPGASLDGLTYVVIGDGAGGDGTIDTAVSIDGQVIGDDGFFVAAESTFELGVADLVTSMNFENGDNVTHLLVSGFTGSVGQDLDTDDDGVLDVLPWIGELDRIALIEEENPPTGTEFHYGPPTIGPDGTFVPGHVKRCPDGGAFDVGAFDPVGGSDTPGAANACSTATALTIPQIQGAAHISAQLGARALTSGLVTAVTGDGFYMQDVAGDGDTSTSDGIFVFTGAAPTVAVGDDVDVEGTVAEFTPGGPSTGNLSITQLATPVVTVTDSGLPLPAPTPISGFDLPSTEFITDDGTVPFDPQNDPLDFYETFEGMYVVIPDALAIAGRDQFGEIMVLPNGGAAATGLNSRGGLTLTATDNNPERIELQLLESLTPGFDPSVTTGDTLGDVTGVLDYRFGFFEVRVTDTFTVTPAGLMPQSGSLAPTANGLTIATYNVLNLDPLVENPANCQDGLADVDDDVGDGRFATIANHIASALNGADIIALQEVQDSDGCEDSGNTDASGTYSLLATEISAHGGPTYAFADLPPVDGEDGGQPGGNIRVGFLYNAQRVTLLPGSLERIVDSNLGDGDAFFESRKPLLARFEFGGEVFTVINMHSSSKGGSTPLFGAVFPAVNGREDQRAEQSAEVNLIVDQELANDPNASIVVLGDMNEFEFTQSVFDALTGEPAPVLDVLTRTLAPLDRYTFNFNGNAQALDHIVVSNNLASRAEFEIVHVNSEFPANNRGSDHDPLVVRLSGGDDTDGDGVDDALDNCTLAANPAQTDTDGDGYGNACDADFDQNCVVSFPDLGVLKANFFTPNALTDLDGNGVTNFTDLGLLKAAFFGPPGPSAAGACTP